MGPTLLVCGVAAAVIGTFRSYGAARAAIGPLVHPGDATRTAVDRERPILARARVRLAVGRLGQAVVWLVVALYGLYLASVGSAVA
jgi:hypothetical protein